MNANWYTDVNRGDLISSALYNGHQHGHLDNYDRASAIKELLVYSAADGWNQLEMSAGFVAFRSSTGYNLTASAVTGVASIIAAGPVAGGRDQAATFTGPTWIHSYFIARRDGTVSTITSTSPPPTGPTLPAGYTHWAYANVTRMNASHQLTPMHQVGDLALTTLDNADVATQTLLSAGQSTTFFTLNASGFVPPNCRMALMEFRLSLIHSAAATIFNAFWRPTVGGFVLTNGLEAVSLVVQNAAVLQDQRMLIPIWLGVAKTIQYRINAAPSTSGGLHIFIRGYNVPV